MQKTSDAAIMDFISDLKHENGPKVRHIRTIPGKQAEYSSVILLPQVFSSLEKMGIKKLYRHQAAAIENARKKNDIVMAVATAGGKSLSYTIPMAEVVFKGGSAIYIAPTNALINDQCANIKKFMANVVPGAVVEKYNGALTKQERSGLKEERISVLLTNPEMLHLSILQYHKGWQDFLSRLELIVVDESHYWRGVPGSHVANIFRRLSRVCEHYGSNPKFFCCSATVGNPVEHASALTSRKVCLVTGDSAGVSEKTYVFYNPYHESFGCSFGEKNGNGNGNGDSHYSTDSFYIFKNLLKRGFKVIFFSRTRSSVERLALQLKAELGDNYPVAAYRGGLLPGERVDIENKLKSGVLRGVITTNALELGIDIGSLDACVIDQFPGSIMSFYQQAGRVGRAGNHSIVVLVAGTNPIDQFYIENHEQFFSTKSEDATVSSRTHSVLAGHLICAGHELPPNKINLAGFGKILNADIESIIKLAADIKKYPYPHYKSLNIRGGGENYTMISGGRVVEADVSAEYARREAFKGAILVHSGSHYIVRLVDDEKHVIFCEETRSDYHTKAVLRHGVTMKTFTEKKKLGECEVFVGRGIVYTQVLGYENVYYNFQSESRVHPLKSNISRSVYTMVFGITIPESIKQHITKGLDYRGGLHGIEHVIANISARKMLVDPLDLGSYNEADTVYIYDSQAGLGAAEKVYGIIEEIIREGYTTVKNCTCETGCPLCIQNGQCERKNNPLDKRATHVIFSKMLEME